MNQIQYFSFYQPNKCKAMLLLLFCISTISLFKANGQPNNENAVRPGAAYLTLIAQSSSDSIVLRWAPSTAGGWSIANELGYFIERITIEESKEIEDAGYIRLSEHPLKPLPLEVWKTYAGPDNHFSAIAAQALYGKLFIPKALDQGSINTLKNAADELSNRFSFSLYAADNDAHTANALGLRFVDNNISPGTRYAYRVFISKPSNEYTFDTAYVMVTAQPEPKRPAPENLRFESGDGSITLFWEETDINPFSGYYIYRSDHEGKNYVKLNNLPLVIVTPDQAAGKAQPSFTDSSTVNYKMYHYRVFGISPFGELSMPAERKAFSKDLLPPPPPLINKPKQISSSEIMLSWTMKEMPDDLKGFIVSRSTSPVLGYTLLTREPLPKSAKEYTDDLSGEPETYYTVASVDTAGNLGFSLPVLAVRIDTIPPAIPRNFKGSIDEKGVATLSWDHHTDPNVIGYRVVWANDPSHEFIQISNHLHRDTVLIDSVNINTLSNHVYYKVASVNHRNQHSALSPILTLRRPDKIPPGEAVFYEVWVSDSLVNLKWHCSSSPDVAKQLLFRKKDQEKKWSLIDSLRPGVSTYTDRKIETNINYRYTLSSVDSAGLTSTEAFPVLARPYDSGKRKAVINLSVVYDQEKQTVNLQWQYSPEKKERWWFVIYKSINGGEFKEYKSVSGSENSFTDLHPVQGITNYGVVLMTSFGGKSEMRTQEIEITSGK